MIYYKFSLKYYSDLLKLACLAKNWYQHVILQGITNLLSCSSTYEDENKGKFNTSDVYSYTTGLALGKVKQVIDYLIFVQVLNYFKFEEFFTTAIQCPKIISTTGKLSTKSLVHTVFPLSHFISLPKCKLLLKFFTSCYHNVGLSWLLFAVRFTITYFVQSVFQTCSVIYFDTSNRHSCDWISNFYYLLTFYWGLSKV